MTIEEKPNFEKGYLSEKSVTIDDVGRDVAVIMYHHRNELFGVIRVCPMDALIPNSTLKLDKKLIPLFEQYANASSESIEQVRVKVYGGDYKYNVVEREILLGKHDSFLGQAVMEYLEEFELHSSQYGSTENRTLKSLIVQPKGIVKVMEDEELLKFNMRAPLMSYDEYQYRRSKSLVR